MLFDKNTLAGMQGLIYCVLEIFYFLIWEEKQKSKYVKKHKLGSTISYCQTFYCFGVFLGG